MSVTVTFATFSSHAIMEFLASDFSSSVLSIVKKGTDPLISLMGNFAETRICKAIKDFPAEVPEKDC